MYQETFRNYKAGAYSNVISLSAQMKTMEPDSVMIPKIDFMNAVANGTQSGVQDFEKRLENYVATYPTAEPTPLANEILTLIRDSSLERLPETD